MPNILSQVSNSLEELAKYSIDSSLIKMIKYHYMDMSYSFQKLTFEKINLAQLLLGGLKEISELDQVDQDKLLTQLIKWNFNTSPFIEYCIGGIVNPKASESGTNESFDWEVALLKTSSTVPFDIHQPNLKVVLKDSLIEASKRRHLEKSNSFHSNESTNFYFNVKLTLNQLLFFFQVFHETGMLQSKNRTGIYQFIAKHIGTEKHQNISIGSMQRKYGRASKLEMKRVRQLLITMLNNINFKHLNS